MINDHEPFRVKSRTDLLEIESSESISISNQSICDIPVTQACYDEHVFGASKVHLGYARAQSLKGRAAIL